MKPARSNRKPDSSIAIDTGGTFTDGVLMTDDRIIDRVKVLSSSALRGRVTEACASRSVLVQIPGVRLPAGLLTNFSLRRPGGDVLARVVSCDVPHQIQLDRSVELDANEAVELTAPFDAPRLAIHLLLGTNEQTTSFDAMIRVATTRGTNALLENRGEQFALIFDEGLEDLLEIGDQSRPDIFALDIERSRVVPRLTLGVRGRLAADGTPLEEIDEKSLASLAKSILDAGLRTVGVALLHAWRNPEREREVARRLRALGIEQVICSTDLSGADQLLPRAETTAVEATLAPIMDRFISDILPDKGRHADSISVMTSAGGLEPSSVFRAKDGLLSGPAGGVAGAARAAHASGLERLLGFDMGGTSTDVSRYDRDFIYRFETRVGPARIQSPCVAIESVAAGGGSICHVSEEGLAVGPRSAGASPGPACYGAGGPLTITDVNLLLGRGDPDHFDIPIDLDHSERALEKLREDLRARGHQNTGREPVLQGLRNIADERMAEAMRSISIKEGADPRRHILVPFGGAGGQHGCAIAERLGIETILIPTDAGVLSAVGLGHARVERFAEKTVMEPLEHLKGSLDARFDELSAEALAELDENNCVVHRRIIALRILGQDSVIQIDHESGVDPEPGFERDFESIYGYPTPDRPIEVAWMRVIAGENTKRTGIVERLETPSILPDRTTSRGMQLPSGMVQVPVFIRNQLDPGTGIDGPALIQDAGATIVVDPGWFGVVQPNHTIILTRDRFASRRGPQLEGADGAAASELVSARLEAIATGMGNLLERTALSVNVKQRLDFSCAILDDEARLLVNAPHMPIHLGSMGICVRRVLLELSPGPGDVVVTNDPACGGSHLPDVTTIAPVHENVDGGRLLGYVAVRAHHAEIGGTRPGSTPPFARNLIEEGVLIPPTLLIRSGQACFDTIEKQLTEAPYPTRRKDENLADLAAQVASTRHGIQRIRDLAGALGTERYLQLAGSVHRNASSAARDAIRRLGAIDRRVEQRLDDGTPIVLHVRGDGNRLLIDFTGTASEHPGNFNAPVAIVTGATVYLMRLLADRRIPMNEGLLEPVDLVVPKGLLDPGFSREPERDPAVCAGNTETSQRIVDTLLLAFELAASSQGTMNNLLLGNDRFGYYETICGGAGATARSPGCSAVHTHMTNTRITDPETLEARYPVRLERFSIRRGSGGAGAHPGGDGVVRCLKALESLEISLVGQHRVQAPYGLAEGCPGETAATRIIRVDGTIETLGGSAACTLSTGDRIEVSTPGGGGWGIAPS
jgi:5-oxoprolinase (ATP-hydrolysing)